MPAGLVRVLPRIIKEAPCVTSLFQPWPSWRPPCRRARFPPPPAAARFRAAAPAATPLSNNADIVDNTLEFNAAAAQSPTGTRVVSVHGAGRPGCARICRARQYAGATEHRSGRSGRRIGRVGRNRPPARRNPQVKRPGRSWRRWRARPAERRRAGPVIAPVAAPVAAVTTPAGAAVAPVVAAVAPVASTVAAPSARRWRPWRRRWPR